MTVIEIGNRVWPGAGQKGPLLNAALAGSDDREAKAMRRLAGIAAFGLIPFMAACSSGLPNVEIPYVHGIGWLSDLKELSVQQIQERVDSSHFLVVSSDGSLPQDVPWELRFTSDRSELGAMVWGMNVSGREWEPFYSFGMKAYRDRGHIPAFIYERGSSTAGKTYIPRVILMLDASGKCISVSELWCRGVRDHPPFLRTADGRWPVYEEQRAHSGKQSS